MQTLLDTVLTLAALLLGLVFLLAYAVAEGLFSLVALIADAIEAIIHKNEKR